MPSLPIPFHSVPGGDPGRPRLLLVAYHFPPDSAVGALRWEKLTGYAAEHGWAVDAITADPSAVDVRDESRLRELPPGTRVYAVRPEPVVADRLADAMLGLRPRRRAASAAAPSAGESKAPRRAAAPRAASLTPDQMRWPVLGVADWKRLYDAWRHYTAEVSWGRGAVRIGERLVAVHAHPVIVSCGPPHIAAHGAARVLAARTARPFVIDLRDPWATVRRLPEAYASPLWFTLSERAERRTVAAARMVVVNTDPVRDMMRAKYPAARVITVMNGYDDEAIPAVERDACFTMAYAGAIYLDRDPRPLIRALARVVRELSLRPGDLRLALIGNVDSYGGVPLGTMAEQEGVAAFVETGGRRPRRDALEFLARAHMLVSLPQDSAHAVPSKVFEFMLFDAWMLALAEPGTATEVVLRGTQVDVAAPSDEAAMAHAIRRRYEQFRAGERPVRAAEPRFSRREQARLLFRALAEIAGNAAPRAPGVAAAATAPVLG